MEQIDYSRHESSEGLASSSDDEEGGSSDDSDEDGTKQIFPALQCMTELSWPAILQYVRESETMAGDYFSMKNREVIDQRIMAAKGMFKRNESLSLTVQKSNEDKDHTEDEDHTKEELVSCTEDKFTCDFCGNRLPRISLLLASQNTDDLKEKVKI